MKLPRAGWFAVGAATAALLASTMPASAVAIVGIACVVAAVATRRASLGVPISVAAVGALLVAARLLALPSAESTVVLPDGSGPWTATVAAVGSRLDGSQRVTVRVDQPARMLVSATLPSYPEVGVGDSITLAGQLREPPDGGYGAYLRRIGVAATIQARSVEVVATSGPSVDAMRNATGDALALVLPEPEAGLASGILIGLRERVDRDLAAAFTTAGASHVVAISGWNIAIVATLVGVAGRRLSARSRASLIGLVVVAYTIAAGGSPSVVRAAAMAGVVLIARESGRAGRAATALGAAAGVLLVVDPGLVADAGFGLSVLATAGLLAWSESFTLALTRLTGDRVPSWLTEGLGVSLAAQFATLPLVLLAFGRLSIVAPIVGLFVVPIVPVAMGAGVVALVAGALVMAGAPAIVGTLLALPAWLSLTVIVRIVEVFASVPFAAIQIAPDVGMVLGILCALGIVLGRLGIGRRRVAPRSSGQSTARSTGNVARLTPATRALLVALCGASLLAGIAFVGRIDRTTRFTVLDVGQGDAILVQTARHHRMLVDGGPDPTRIVTELDRRVPPWDRRLDLVVLTHPHEDHVAGLARILDRYAVSRVYVAGMLGPGPGYEAFARSLAELAMTSTQLSTGTRFQVDEIAFSVLWPDAGSVPLKPPDAGRAINDVSIVLVATVGERRVLLTGDVEDDVDPRIAARSLPIVDVLKVAHHGSKTATSDAFLAATRPRIAIVSAGTGNPYGHPAPRTIERLQAAGARVLRTDLDGSVEVRLEDGRIDVSAAGGRKRAVGGDAVLASARTPSPFACGISVLDHVAKPKPDDSPAPPIQLGRSRLRLGYDHLDDHPGAGRGRPPAAMPRPAGVVHSARSRRRGGRRVAGARRVRSPSDRSPARRVGRAPP